MNRRVVVFPGKTHGGDQECHEECNAVDEGDHSLVWEMQSRTFYSTYRQNGKGRIHYLFIQCTRNSLNQSFPNYLKNMTALTDLNISKPNMESLPSSIGQLQGLEKLRFCCVENLVKLPDAIGDLVSLKQLSLNSAGIESLPRSIGRLQNLEVLDLNFSTKLKELPEEIGDLCGLRRLLLSCSNIHTLPPSVGKLQNLEFLSLIHTKNFVRFPEELGDLSTLKVLHLSESSITALPDSIENLTALTYLNLFETGITELSNGERHRDVYLSQVIKKCPSLQEIVPSGIPKRREIQYALAVNMERSQTGFGSTRNNTYDPIEPQLWPHLLEGARSAFPRYFFDNMAELVYQLLLDGRESFLGLIAHRKNKKRKRIVDVATQE